MKGENKITNGLIWTFAERIAAQLVSTIVTIILARILDPTHYGIISIVTVFISLCNIFVTSGFGSAVVQKKEVSDVTFNTAFSISECIAIILYMLLFICAPYISKFYNINELTLVIRILALRLPLAAFNSIQQAHIQRNMKFKKFFYRTIVGTVISAVVGIVLAIIGCSVWALVAQYLTNSIIDSLMLHFLGDWKPKICFSIKEAKYIFKFGWKVLITDVVFTLENDIRSLIIGKVFGSSDLAYYDQGKKYPSLLVTNINTSINKVMLPAYSKKQDDIFGLKKLLRKSIQVGVFVLAPILIGFASISENFVYLVLTDKWIEAIPYIQIFCIAYLTRPLESSCHQALLAIGKSGTVLFLMILINIFSLITVLIAVFIFKSVFMIAVGSVLSSIISLLGFMIMTGKHLKYNIKEQIQDIFPAILVSCIMGMGVYFINSIPMNRMIKMIIQIIIGLVIYLFFSHILKIKAYLELKNKILNKSKNDGERKI